jgi:hypothetical protein
MSRLPLVALLVALVVPQAACSARGLQVAGDALYAVGAVASLADAFARAAEPPPPACCACHAHCTHPHHQTCHAACCR